MTLKFKFKHLLLRFLLCKKDDYFFLQKEKKFMYLVCMYE